MRPEEFRLFYSSIEVNILMLIPFQILRGILLGIFILPSKNMVKQKPALTRDVKRNVGNLVRIY
jgi:uncharacterized protein YneF (UPF0154 family)